MFDRVEFHKVLLVSKPSPANMRSKTASTVFISESQHQLGSCFNYTRKYQTWARGTVSYDRSYKHRHAWQEEALHVGNTRAAICLFVPFFFPLFASLCISVTSYPVLPPSLAEVWKCSLASHLMKWTWTTGNCQVRATLSSRSGGLSWAWMEETSAPWGHIKRPGCSLSLFPAVFRYMTWRATLTHHNTDCSSDTVETQYAPGPLSHTGCTKSKLNNVMLLARSHIIDEPVWTGWEKIDWIQSLDDDFWLFWQRFEAICPKLYLQLCDVTCMLKLWLAG